MATTTITAEQLREWLDGGRDFVLLDVVPGEYFAEKHIPGACCACVYEVVFLDRVRDIVPAPEREIVVYGSSARSRASAVAAEKLAAAGYPGVVDFPGGLEEWEALGYPLEADPAKAVPVPTLADRSYAVDPAKSTLHWVGRNLGGRHHGSIGVKGGGLTFSGGNLTGGNIAIDMETIRNSDLTDETWNRLLINHLKSEDFFDVTRFPTASFELARATLLPDATPGTPNHRVEGILTIRGVGNRVEFPALIAPRDDGGVSAQAFFDIDRTRWKVVYGSGKLFEKLGMHLVNDIISLELQVVAY